MSLINNLSDALKVTIIVMSKMKIKLTFSFTLSIIRRCLEAVDSPLNGSSTGCYNERQRMPVSVT